MSTLNHLFDLPDQICYVQCGFCSTILLVSVPCSSLSMLAVTVRCGHCSCLLSVNMMKASFVPLHLLASLTQDERREELRLEEVDKQNNNPLDMRSPSMVVSNSDHEEEDTISVNPIVNKPPEKRQRAPSAYNRFIKEEIRRLKGENPSMTHKKAFSTAAKNWAQFPPIQYQYKGDGPGGESYTCTGQREANVTWDSDVPEAHEMAKFSVRERLQGIPYGQGHPSSE